MIGSVALQRIGARVLGLGHRLDRTPRRRAYEEWLRAEGDRTLRLDYPLKENSVVVDVGGYWGDWASDIYSRYRCAVHVVEPIPHFAQAITKRFRGNPDISVHQIALGPTRGRQPMSIEQDRSRIAGGKGSRVLVEVRKGSEFMDSLRANSIELMKINIEGGEYDLIEDLVESGWIQRIRDVQVQFHDFVPNAEVRMAHATNLLRRTHHCTYRFPFVWENWRKMTAEQEPGLSPTPRT